MWYSAFTPEPYENSMESKYSRLISFPIISACCWGEVWIIRAHQIALRLALLPTLSHTKHTRDTHTQAAPHLTTEGQIHALFMHSVVWAAALCKLGSTQLKYSSRHTWRSPPASWLLSALSHKHSTTCSPVHFLETICGEEEALDFGMTGFEGTAISQERRRQINGGFFVDGVVWVRANALDY